jgi:hypothetical protein
LSEDIRQSSSKPEDFVSGYALTNPFEDFAEAHNAYHLHNKRFRTIAQSNSTLQQKYNKIA